MADRAATRGVVAGLIVLLAACASNAPAPPGSDLQASGDLPEGYYRRLVAKGKPVFRVDPAGSLVVMEVRRRGALAQLGHDHIVASRDIAGYVAPDEGRADFQVPLNSLVVDEPALRTEAGFDTEPSAADIADTRRNMLEKVLETDRHPEALIAVSAGPADADPQQFRIAITLHGTTRTVDAVAQVVKGTDEVTVTGTTAIDQSWFGITPLSLLGGAVAVQDRVNIRFRMRARRIP
jgi:hypothetical protein